MASSSSPSSKSSSSSASQLLSTLIPVLVISAVFYLLFLFFRKRQLKVYEPRRTVKTVPDSLRPDESPTGLFGWATHLFGKSNTYILQHTGPDGYFFLRYLFEFMFICLLGCLLTWPILFPVTITNSNHLKQLDMLAYGNVKNKWRYLAHVFVSWLFFGAVIFVIYRELVYYTTFRHALQTTPLYDSLLSSRTLLLTELPESTLEEAELRRHFPTATNVWYARDYKKLQDLVKERKKLAKKYEGALNLVLIKAVKLRNKCLKKNKPAPEPADDLNKYLKDGKKRPTHRLKFLIGRKVDTLDYGAEHLGELNKEIGKLQAEHNANAQAPAVFMEFPSQLELQKAYQAIPYSQELKKCGRRTGVAPDDIVWSNLSLTPTKRRVKLVLANTFLTLMIIFWAIPVAVVGAISNINFITDKLTFLKFINKMPSKLMGIITSLLPVVALAVLMSFVPIIIRKVGKVSGKLTVQEVESYCQNWYYAFQAVHSFLVITIASAAVTAISSIIANPGSALSLLATKLPKASNFYLSYMCLLGLTFSSKNLLRIVPLILAQFLGKILDKTPRSKWTRATTLAQPSYSVLYPGFQLTALIAICYSIIAPLILGFAAIAFFLIFACFIYNFVYVMQPNTHDARGRNYALMLFQLFVALYLAEAVLVALFVFAKNWPCVALEGAFIAFTAACHIYFKIKFLPLFDTVPVSALKYAAGDKTFQYPMYDQGLKEIKNEGKNYWEGGKELGLTESHADQALADPDTAEESDLKTKVGSAEKRFVDDDSAKGQENLVSSKPVSSVLTYFKPRLNSFESVRASFPATYFNYIEYNPSFVKTAYTDPAVNDDEPHIWIAKDPMGLSEIEKNKALEQGVDCTDADAGFQENLAEYYGPPPSYEEALRV